MNATDPRLAALYDVDNPDGVDHDCFRRLVARVAPRRIIDIGCGTGLLTVTLAAPDRDVVGVDLQHSVDDVVVQEALRRAQKPPAARAG